MSKTGIKAARNMAPSDESGTPPDQPELNEEDRSKDAFFVQVAQIAEAMVARHGEEFAMGTLVLSARFIAERKPLINRTRGGEETIKTVKPV